MSGRELGAVLTIIAALAFLAMASLRLIGLIDWPLWVITFPLWAGPALAILLGVVALFHLAIKAALPRRSK